MNKILVKWLSFGVMATALSLFTLMNYATADSATFINEPVQACVVARDVELTNDLRKRFAQCLGWQADLSSPVCLGDYQPIVVAPLATDDEVRIMADRVSFYQNKRSALKGHVEVQQAQKIVNAQTAYVYRDAKTNEITQIELLGNVHYLEPDRLMIARKVTLNPQDKSGKIEDALYRFNINKSQALLPAWGRAKSMERFPNSDYLLKRATYTTCAPQDKAWDLRARSIAIDNKKATGVARDVTLRLHNWPILYSPYLSFPTNKERKSGFLMPIAGFTNVSGFHVGVPYYLNLAPNYDLLLTPHLYSERGIMLGAEYRYLTAHSRGVLSGSFLPNDAAYGHFLREHQAEFPFLRDKTANRWSLGLSELTRFTPDLKLHLKVQQVSDDYYLQDFSTNLALITKRQLPRQADLIYSSENWTFKGMVQSYQTLHPVNETPILDQYERLPQLLAHGFYYDLPWHANFNVLGQYDQFSWPSNEWASPQIGVPRGPRLHLNPVLAFPQRNAWGYIIPSVELVENYYEVQTNWRWMDTQYNRFIPRYDVKGGIFLERDLKIGEGFYTQTLEPSLFYLRVPYQNQTPIPIYDTANMIFNVDQLFRTNRFSGFDRIGDANQLSYVLTSRWLEAQSGMERAFFTVGQIKYFSDRKVQLCRRLQGDCVGSPFEIGQISPFAPTSPIASRMGFRWNPVWSIASDYVWNPSTSSTNNGNVVLHYQPTPLAMFNFGYSYLFNGDVTKVRNNGPENNALNQAIAAYSLPLTDKWSTVGAYSQNISKNYAMLSLLGLQYDSCCWAVRLLGGRTFKNLNEHYEPKYNNNIYVQILLKGLGSVANNDPTSVLNTYIPGYSDPFRR